MYTFVPSTENVFCYLISLVSHFTEEENINSSTIQSLAHEMFITSIAMSNISGLALED